MTVVTVTPNPSLDRTYEIAALDRGEVLRAGAASIDAGGKGVNVARALAANSVATRAVLPAGGPEGEQLADLLTALRIDTRVVAVTEPVRTNVSLVEPDGTVTKVNAAGAKLGEAELAALRQAAAEDPDADWVAACGSLPPGVPADAYAELTERVHDRGGRIAVDTSGPALGACVDAGPDLLKPNRQELGEVTGTVPRTLGDVVEAGRQLRERGVAGVLVSLGADGAVLVEAAEVVHADTPPVTARSNVGAGDATLAGFLAAGGAGPEALRQAVAWGAAAVGLPGTSMPGPDDVDLASVRLQAVDPDRPLTT